MNNPKLILSDALEANLRETRANIVIPDKQAKFLELSVSYYSIHNRARECFTELNHPFSNSGFVIDELRNISLGDFWFYERIECDESVWNVVIDIFSKVFIRELSEKQGEDIVHTFVEFIEKLHCDIKKNQSAIIKSIQVLNFAFERHSIEFVRNSSFIVKVFSLLNWGDYVKNDVIELLKNIISATANYWSKSTNSEKWIKSHKKLFSQNTLLKFKNIDKEYFNKIIIKAEAAVSIEQILLLPTFNDFSAHVRQLYMEFDNFHEKFFYFIYLLSLDSFDNQRDTLLRDFNSLLKNLNKELDEGQIIEFLNNAFGVLFKLNNTNQGTVLDCILTLGKEIFATNNIDHINYFEELLINNGFVGPGALYVNNDWQISVNEYHVKNIRIWMELIELSPTEYTSLLAALIINLRLGGIFISDTDLFQRDVTLLLNSNVKPIFKQVKQLARLFPVYFNEIGAEGELREVTTVMDELSHRNDKLIHFLRKQVHTESNNTHINLTRSILKYWCYGDKKLLEKIVPNDVKLWLDTNSKWFIGVNKLIDALCNAFNCTIDELINVPSDNIKKKLSQIKDSDEIDKQRLAAIFRLVELLNEKYSFNTFNLSSLLRKYNFFKPHEIDELIHEMNKNNNDKSIKLLFSMIKTLNNVIMSSEKTEGWDDIYHKRHIAIGIPSMYGKYKEPKFDALGLIYRLEDVATGIIQNIINELNLDYISARTLRRIYTILEFYIEGLKLDGITAQSFESNLEMFKYSLSSASFSAGQYLNILQFMLSSVREIINKYFFRVYDRPLKQIVPLIFKNEIKKYIGGEKQFLNSKSEFFYREMLTSAFLVQSLDNFISKIINSFRSMVDNYSDEVIRSIMSYNNNLIISPLYQSRPEIDNQVFLGSKAYFLKKLFLLDYPIPPGFVITTEVFRRREAILKNPNIEKELYNMIFYQLKTLERLSKKEFGNPHNPLLLSVRSGTAISMPGAMNTYLNVGLNDKIVEQLSKKDNYGWTSWDCYRRFLQSWAMSFGVSRDEFDETIIKFKKLYDVNQKIDFKPTQMREIAYAYKEILHKHNIHFKDDPKEQLIQVIMNVFESWYSDRACVYRDYMQIAEEWGTAVIVQQMVLGNLHRTSGTGVLFTHAPEIKKSGVHLFGDFTLCSQGEDIVAGLVNPWPITESQCENIHGSMGMSLEKSMEGIYKKLYDISVDLTEKHGFNHQEIEFTFESDDPKDLYILQTRDHEIKKPDLCYVFDVKSTELELLGRGIGLGRGVMNGVLAFDIDDLKKYKNKEVKRILVRPDTVPDDIGMIFECDGLITARGGATSHAAVTAVRLEKTCVVNCVELIVNEKNKTCNLNNKTLKSGDKIAIDGNTGSIYLGNYKIKLTDIE